MAIRRVLAALCIAVMVVGAIGVTLYVLSHKDLSTMMKPVRSSAPMPAGPSIPTTEEFKVGIDVTAQDCSAVSKCVYTYTVSPNYVGTHPLPEQDFTVFYEVRGGFAGQNGLLTVGNGQAKVYKDVQIEGPKDAHFDVVVTQISLVAGPKPIS